jgi:hypothetical protein
VLIQIPSVIVIEVVLITIVSITIFIYQSTAASSNDGRSIAPNYLDGYKVGIIQGIQDHRNGDEHDDRCPSENTTILWCIGFEIGYNDGYYDPEIVSEK